MNLLNKIQTEALAVVIGEKFTKEEMQVVMASLVMQINDNNVIESTKFLAQVKAVAMMGEVKNNEQV